MANTINVRATVGIDGRGQWFLHLQSDDEAVAKKVSIPFGVDPQRWQDGTYLMYIKTPQRAEQLQSALTKLHPTNFQKFTDYEFEQIVRYGAKPVLWLTIPGMQAGGGARQAPKQPPAPPRRQTAGQGGGPDSGMMAPPKIGAGRSQNGMPAIPPFPGRKNDPGMIGRNQPPQDPSQRRPTIQMPRAAQQNLPFRNQPQGDEKNWANQRFGGGFQGQFGGMTPPSATQKIMIGDNQGGNVGNFPPGVPRFAPPNQAPFPQGNSQSGFGPSMGGSSWTNPAAGADASQRIPQMGGGAVPGIDPAAIANLQRWATDLSNKLEELSHRIEGISTKQPDMTDFLTQGEFLELSSDYVTSKIFKDYTKNFISKDNLKDQFVDQAQVEEVVKKTIKEQGGSVDTEALAESFVRLEDLEKILSSVEAPSFDPESLSGMFVRKEDFEAALVAQSDEVTPEKLANTFVRKDDLDAVLAEKGMVEADVAEMAKSFATKKDLDAIQKKLAAAAFDPQSLEGTFLKKEDLDEALAARPAEIDPEKLAETFVRREDLDAALAARPAEIDPEKLADTFVRRDDLDAVLAEKGMVEADAAELAKSFATKRDLDEIQEKLTALAFDPESLTGTFIQKDEAQTLVEGYVSREEIEEKLAALEQREEEWQEKHAGQQATLEKLNEQIEQYSSEFYAIKRELRNSIRDLQEAFEDYRNAGVVTEETLGGILNERLEGLVEAKTLDERLEGLVETKTLDERLEGLVEAKALDERLEGLVDTKALDERLEGLVEAKTLDERLEGLVETKTLDERLEGLVEAKALDERLEGLVDTKTLDERLEGLVETKTLDERLEGLVEAKALDERLEGLVDTKALDERLEGLVEAKALDERLEGLVDTKALDERLEGLVETKTLDERLEGLVEAKTLDERLEGLVEAKTFDERLDEKLADFEKSFEEKLSKTLEASDRLDEVSEAMLRNTINIESLSVNNHEFHERLTEIQDSLVKFGEDKKELLEQVGEKAREEVARVEEVALSRPKLEWNHFAQGLFKMRENLGLDQRESWWMREFTLGWEMLVERVQAQEQKWLGEEVVEGIMQQVMENPRYKVLRELGAIERAGATYGEVEEGVDANPVALALQTVSRLMILSESIGGTGMELQNDQGQELSDIVMKIVADLYLAMTSGGVEELEREQFEWLNSIAEVAELLLHLPRIGKAFDPFSSKVAGQEESGFGGWHHGGTVKSIVKPGFHSSEGEIIEYALVQLEES